MPSLRNWAIAAASMLCVWPMPLLGQSNSPPPSGWFGNVFLGGGRANFRADKVYAVSYRVTDRSVEVVDSVLAYGTAKTLPPAQSDFVIELVSSDGRPLTSRTATDPRQVVIEHQGNVELPTGLLTVRVPFSALGSKIRLRRMNDGSTLDVDVRDAELAFCSRSPNDPDCETVRPR